MDKKTIFIIILVGLVCLAIGFIVGSKANGGLFQKQNDLIGSYECSYWNGKDASIIILDDTNIIYLGQSTTYTRDGNTLKVVGGNPLTIVPNGLMNTDHLFKKVN